MRIKEKTLILPALYIIENNPNINASDLIKKSVEVFNPEGEDAEILNNRNDTKFSQIARNLKSHRAVNGMEKWTHYNNGKYLITDEGKAYLYDNINAIEYLFNNNFEYTDVQLLVNSVDKNTENRKVVIYDENRTILEGMTIKKETTIRKRSKELRAAAIAYYTDSDGHIKCAVCGFDFWDFYGDIGKGYIDIHHEKPLYQYSDEDFHCYVNEAVKMVKPVCANCHRMIHRGNKVRLIEDIKGLLDVKG